MAVCISPDYYVCGVINEVVSAYFEYIGEPDERPAEGQSLELHSAETLDNGVLWLRYRIHRD